MKRSKPPCPKERLILEYRLLVAGKILPDAGSTEAHIQERLAQIQEALRAMDAKNGAPAADIDHLFTHRVPEATNKPVG
jgi:hypothetical protein